MDDTSQGHKRIRALREPLCFPAADKKFHRKGPGRPSQQQRKRSFRGNRYTKEQEQEYASTSAKKLKGTSDFNLCASFSSWWVVPGYPCWIGEPQVKKSFLASFPFATHCPFCPCLKD
ncbi:hypothetical protein J437_LFUL010901 [Ladona fulva]|uniref:Uncharacterized protein n=1 Tax=Ladona fulva TaxID=123851 RepID=A0A8K0K9V4_LADFU|nr:hypothetical protein J437_LFUL010901 [Ladona fulva]